jgi:hypothetical protein
LNLPGGIKPFIAAAKELHGIRELVATIFFGDFASLK